MQELYVYHVKLNVSFLQLGESPNEYTPAMFQAGNTIEMDDIEDDIPHFNDVDNLDKYSAPDPPPPEPANEGNRDSDGINFVSNHSLCQRRLTLFY